MSKTETGFHFKISPFLPNAFLFLMTHIFLDYGMYKVYKTANIILDIAEFFNVISLLFTDTV